MNSTQTYRDVLRNELLRRKRKNPGYSQRAYARDLGIRSNRLSEILRGKQGISTRLAAGISDRLKHGAEERRHFCNLVRVEQGRASATERELAAIELEESRRNSQYAPLSIDRFKVISEWYHLAILELTKLSDFERDPAWIAKKLSITKDQAVEAVLKLKKLRMLEERNGTWVLPAESNNLGSEISAESIKKFHEQYLRKAMVALRKDALEDREFRTTLFAIKKENLPDAKKRIDEFWKKLDQDLGVNSKGDNVYGLAIQFFNLTSGGEN